MEHNPSALKLDGLGKVGLALGSGAARGWAHIGVIRALSQAGIQVDCIAGTSIGALVGAVHASGQLDALEAVVKDLDWKQIAFFFDMVLPKSGLLDGKKVSEFVRSHVRQVRIEELPIPFCAVATEINSGREVHLNQGDIIEAVRASLAVPGIFTPVKKDGVFLVDGGLVNPVPVDVVRGMGADFVIAVDINHDLMASREESPPPAPASQKRDSRRDKGSKRFYQSPLLEGLSLGFSMKDLPGLSQIKQWAARDPSPSIFEVLVTSIIIMEHQITASRLAMDPPDLMLRPKLGDIRFLEFNRAQEAIDLGFEEARLRLEERFGWQ